MPERRKVLNGFVWSSVERFSDLFIKFGIQLFLARLLLPEDFGLIAMVVVFMTIGIGIMDSGFTQVVIQRSELSEDELTTVFYANLVMGAVMTMLVFFVAPYIAHFYGEVELTALLRFLSLTIFLTALGRIQSSQMMRSMLFKRIGLVTLPVHLLGGILALVLAYMGFGVWALAWNGVAVSALSSIGFWLAMGWRPTGTPSWGLFKSMLPFGMQMVGVRVLNLIAENGMFVVVGRVFSVTQVGFLQRAHSLRMISSNTICVVGERVLFPHFSDIQTDVKALRRAYLRSLLFGGIVFAFVLSYMAGNATDIILILFGEVWLPSANYFEVLCALAFVYVFHRVVLVYIKSQGKGAFLMRLTVIEQLMVLVAIGVSVQWGVFIMLWSIVVSSTLSLLLKFAFVSQKFKCPLVLQFRNLIIPLLTGVCLWWVTQFSFYTGESPIVRLLESTWVVTCVMVIAGFFYIRRANVDLLKVLSFVGFRKVFKSIL